MISAIAVAETIPPKRTEIGAILFASLWLVFGTLISSVAGILETNGGRVVRKRRLVATAAIILAGHAMPALADSPVAKIDQPLASTIDYALPSMSVTVAVDLTLKDCATAPMIEPAVTITPVIGPESHLQYHFTLDAALLQSFSRDKNLSIETYPNGTLKTINGGATDQTGSILTSIIKFATSLAMMGGPGAENTTPKVCNASTMLALRKVKALSDGIDRLRGGPKPGDPAKFTGDLLSGDPEKARHAQDAITALATEIARIQTTDLKITLPPTTYVLDLDHKGMHIPVTQIMLKKWIDPPAGGQQVRLKDLALGLCVIDADKVAAAGVATCGSQAIQAGLNYLTQYSIKDPNGVPTGDMAVEPLACDGGNQCPRTLVFREPVNAVVVVAPESTGYTKGQGTILARQDMAISQWGKLSYVPIKAGFGKSITFSMSFDASGHKISESWNYKARGAGIFSAASSVADASATLYHDIDGRSLAAEKAQLDQLTTQKNLNQILFCKAVIDAGGFTCPTQ